MTPNLTPITQAPRDGSYVRIARPEGGYVLAYWCRDAWRFASGAEIGFEATHFLPKRGRVG